MAAPTLSPIRPSAPTRMRYQSQLDALIDEMQHSLTRELLAAYRDASPSLAQDASPARVLQAAFNKLQRRWLKRFDEFGPKLSDWFATAVKDRSDRSLMADMRKAGLTVRFKMTAAMRDSVQAVIDENIGLIRSIGEQHLTQVRTVVMQSVQNGRDLAHVSRELQKRYGVTKRRAAFIARDQNNKATAVMTRTRHLELGVKKARWLHSAGGKTPRPEHVAFSGKTYDIAKGHDFNNGEGVVWPGTAINCRCVSIPIIPGFDD